MKILHTADWHLGRCLEQNSRLAEQADFLDELGIICKDESIDLLLVTGDVFDAYNPPAAAEKLFYSALEKLAGQGPCTIVVIAGNHDNPDRLAAAAPLAYRHGIFILGYPSSDVSELKQRQNSETDIVLAAGPGYLRIKPSTADCVATILTLPYPSESRLAEMTDLLAVSGEEALAQDYTDRIGRLLAELAAAHFADDTVNLVVAHLFVQGGWSSDSERTLQMGSAMLVDPGSLPSAAQYIALGHLHRPQAVSGSPAPARYAGSPLAYSFSETGVAKSVCLIEASPGGQAQIRTLPLRSGRQLRRWQAREGLPQAMAWAAEGRDAGCWIDVEITTDHLPTATELKALRDLNPGILYIRSQLTGSADAALAPADRTSRRIEELFAEFYLFRNGVPIPGDVLSDFIRLAAAPAEVEV
jgi:exonuclease SbcD